MPWQALRDPCWWCLGLWGSGLVMATWAARTDLVDFAGSLAVVVVVVIAVLRTVLALVGERGLRWFCLAMLVLLLVLAIVSVLNGRAGAR